MLRRRRSGFRRPDCASMITSRRRPRPLRHHHGDVAPVAVQRAGGDFVELHDACRVRVALGVGQQPLDFDALLVARRIGTDLHLALSDEVGALAGCPAPRAETCVQLLRASAPSATKLPSPGAPVTPADQHAGRPVEQAVRVGLHRRRLDAGSAASMPGADASAVLLAWRSVAGASSRGRDRRALGRAARLAGRIAARKSAPTVPPRSLGARARQPPVAGCARGSATAGTSCACKPVGQRSPAHGLRRGVGQQRVGR